MKSTCLALLAAAISTATPIALDPHVEAVIRTVEGARGKVEKTDDVVTEIVNVNSRGSSSVSDDTQSRGRSKAQPAD